MSPKGAPYAWSSSQTADGLQLRRLRVSSCKSNWRCVMKSAQRDWQLLVVDSAMVVEEGAAMEREKPSQHTSEHAGLMGGKSLRGSTNLPRRRPCSERPLLLMVFMGRKVYDGQRNGARYIFRSYGRGYGGLRVCMTGRFLWNLEVLGSSRIEISWVDCGVGIEHNCAICIGHPLSFTKGTRRV
jgi:hypothetical protein